jgi:peptidoglycan/LPS O-acetylase OafA/YrhL
MTSSTALPDRELSVPPASAKARTFLPYLEGMRGFFSIYIALSHVLYRLTSLRPGAFPIPPHFIAFSHNSIAIFIVISGYVLGLPVARDGQTFRGGLRTYAKRRAFRILPAYYAALALAIPIAFFVTPIYAGAGHPEMALTHHQFIVSTILHSFLLQNISNSLIDTIDGPMWSIAIECDCYILFPLVFVPLARRFGFSRMVVCAFGIGLLPVLVGALRHQGTNFHFASSCPWYIGLFALGYAAANFSVENRAAAIQRLERWPWALFALVFTVAMIVSIALTPLDPAQENNGNRWFADILIGLALASQFTADAQARKAGRRTWFEALFTFRPLLIVGTFSYSFYLVHLPIIDVVMSVTKPDWSIAQVVGLGAIAFLAAIAFAYVFYCLIERPSMTAYRKRGDKQLLRTAQAQEIPDFVPARSDESSRL